MTDTVTSTPSAPAPVPSPTPAPVPAPSSTPRRVAANAFNPFAAQIVTKVLMLFYAIVQYRLIGGGAYALGDYFLAGLVFMYTGTVADWGLGTLLTREGARARGTGTEAEHVARLFGETLVLRVVISLALFVPVALFTGIYLTWFSLAPEGAWSIVILTIALIPGALSSSVTALLFAYERMSLPAVIGIATSFVNVALGVGMLLLGWGIIGLSLSAALTTLVTAAIFFRVLRRDFPAFAPGSAIRPHIRRTETLDLLAKGWPLMLNALLIGLFFRVDQFVIKASAGSHDLAAGGVVTVDPAAIERASSLAVERYQAAYSFLNFVLLITPAITLALFPRMARHAISDRPRLAYEYHFALKVLLMLAVPIVALTVWFAPLLITIMTGGKSGYLPASAVALQILIFFLPFSFINGLTQYVLISLDLQRLITRAFAATVIFNVAANLVLVPAMGIDGAAITTVLSELVLLLPFLFWVGRHLGRVPIISIALKPTIAGLAVFALGWALQDTAHGWSDSLTSLVVYAAAGLLLLAAYAGVLALSRPFAPAELAALKSVFHRG